jgi:NADH:ubiquinone oxidoreductase subunit K
MLLALPLWTLFVWATRIKNVADDGGGAGELVLPIGFTVLALAALVERRRAILLLAAATIVVWAIRLPFVLVHDHSGAFKVVHAALAVVSLALAVAAISRLRSPASPTRRSSARA